MAGGCPAVLLTLITAFNLAAALELLGFVFTVAVPSDGCFLSLSVVGGPGVFLEEP